MSFKKAEIKDTDTFFERFLKHYINLKLHYKGSILLFDDALWFAENFKLTVFELHGVPFVQIPGNLTDYYLQWAMLQTKSVKKQNRLQGSFARELDNATLH